MSQRQNQQSGAGRQAKRILAVFVGLFGVNVFASIPQKQQGPDYGRVGDRIIRVRIAEGAPVARVSGNSLTFGSAGSDRLIASPGQSAPKSDSETWELRCQDDRVRAVRVGGGPGKTLELASPARVRSSTGFIHYNDRPYRELIRVHAAGSLCEVVNELSIEKYLSGLVNAEFNSRWNEEAIAAQVVAARSYALYQIEDARREGLHFDVDSTVWDQVYDGAALEDARAEKVVRKTRGIALTVGPAASPAPIKAFYHSTCAGHTETPEKVWGRAYPGFGRGVPCPFCANSPVMHWNIEISPEELSHVLRRGGSAEGVIPSSLQGLRGMQLTSLAVARTDAAGRVVQVLSRWRTRLGTIQEWAFSGARLRSWLGAARFRSTAFEIYQAGFFRFEGRGNGHGVGLCQYGAKGMGEQGYRMASILKHYYPDAVLRRLW